MKLPIEITGVIIGFVLTVAAWSGTIYQDVDQGYRVPDESTLVVPPFNVNDSENLLQVAKRPAPASITGDEYYYGGCPDNDTGIMQAGVHYIYAMEEVEVPSSQDNEAVHLGQLRITVYGPPQFPPTNYVARWPLTVAGCLRMAEAEGLDGICAASPGTGLYNAVRDDVIPIIEVEGHGTYLCIDRMASWINGGIDIYDPELNQSRWFAHNRTVRRIR